MDCPDSLRLSGRRFSVEYQLTGTEAEALAKADSLCVDQTVELPRELVPAGVIRDQILGRVESFERLTPSRCQALVSFPSELVERDFTQLLGVVFGISSLKAGIRVARLHLPEQFLEKWPGPRFGRTGLRARIGVYSRPLVCGVLKPLGLSVSELADLAYSYAVGGLDLVKDDQGLADQKFCSFEDRVRRCAEAVARANQETGHNCLYVPHVTGTGDVMRGRSLLAKRVGAGGLLVCPGLTGFAGLHQLAQDNEIALPLLSHPSLLGSYMVHEESGMAPAVLFGQLPRLAGADVSIYPSYGKTFAITQDDCRVIAKETSVSWALVKPNFPTAAGRMTPERVKEVCGFYGNDVIIIAGGSLLKPGGNVSGACRGFIDEVTRWIQA